jgi:Cdc6-like AAA superfamily ATPase
MKVVVCIKIPSNVYNFKSYIYGMPLEKFVIILSGISLAAILFTYSISGTLVAVLIYFAFMAYIKFDFSNIFKLRKIYFHGINKAGIRFVRNESLFGVIGKQVFSVVEISNRELYTDSKKSIQIGILKNMIEDLECSINIIARPEIYDGKNYYRTFIILKTQGDDIESSMDLLARNLSTVISKTVLHGKPVKDEEIVKSLFPEQVIAHSRYIEANKKFLSYLDLLDTDYSQDFFYQTAIERLGFMVEINMEINRIKNPDMTVKRLLSSRKAELAYTKSGHFATNVKKQISSLEYMAAKDKLYNLSVRFALISRHPAILRSNTELFKKTMESIGFRLRSFNYFNRDSFNPLNQQRQGIKYMMDSNSISEIFPCSFTPVPLPSQEALGINSITAKPFYFKPFNGNSYNIVITGETGSGKSYFTKKLLDQNRNAKVYIIDPLGEYTSGMIVDLSLGEYIDFPIKTSEMSNIISIAMEKLTGIPKNNITKILLQLIAKSGVAQFDALISKLKQEYCEENSMPGTFYSMPFKTPVELHENSAVFRFGHKNESLRDAFFELIFSQVISIIEKEEGEKIVVMDESHLFLRNSKEAEIIDMLARNSRHFNTSLITVTQNIDDYYMNNYSQSVLMNSINYFIFRQHGKIKNQLYLGYEIDPSSLVGGSHFNYSECFYSTGSLIRKLKISDQK